MRFRSKIDWWLYLIFIGWTLLNIWFLALLVINGGAVNWILAITFTPITIFLIVPIWFRTYYQFDEDGLHIQCGLGKGRKIPYESIVSAHRTRNPLSSSALSLDRIEVKFQEKGYNATILISPKDIQRIFEQLILRNESIEVSTDIKPCLKR